MTQRLPLPLPDNLIDEKTGKASQSWSRWFQDANRTLVTINDDLLGLAGDNTGVNTGDQTITLSGAVAGTGTGAITTTYSGTVGVATGGTGVTTMTTAYAPVCAGTTATGALQVASTGLSTSGYVLTSNGASAVPSFQAIPADSDDWVYISTGTASSSSEIDFTGFSTYTSYQIRFYGLLPATNAVDLRARISIATTFQTDADYKYGQANATNTTFAGTQSTGATAIILINNMGNSNDPHGGTIDILGVGSGFETAIICHSIGQSDGGNMRNNFSKGYYSSTSTIDGIRLYASSGNLATGVFKLYGIR